MGLSISVVIPCHNGAQFLRETLTSVLAQTRPPSEVIVVDDGSTDGSGDVARSFGPPVAVITQANSGLGPTRNRGIQAVSGDVIALVDADDLWHPEKLERQLSYLERNPDVGAVVTSVDKFSGDISQRFAFLRIDDDVMRNSTALDFLIHPRVNQSAVVMRTHVAKAVPYPDNRRDSEDMLQAVELRMAAVIGAVPDVLTFYRQHTSQLTQGRDHMSKSLRTRLDWAAENYTRLGVPTAADAMRPLLDHVTHLTMLLYWQRRIAEFKRDRAQLLAAWPQDIDIPAELRRSVPPEFLLRLKDRLFG
jgi:glycosyltransferase involved in cell wall biosynthesis